MDSKTVDRKRDLIHKLVEHMKEVIIRIGTLLLSKIEKLQLTIHDILIHINDHLDRKSRKTIIPSV